MTLRGGIIQMTTRATTPVNPPPQKKPLLLLLYYHYNSIYWSILQNIHVKGPRLPKSEKKTVSYTNVRARLSRKITKIYFLQISPAKMILGVLLRPTVDIMVI